MPTSEFPTDVILKQTWFAVGIYVKSPEGVGVCMFGMEEEAAGRLLYLVSAGRGFAFLPAYFYSLYSSMRRTKSDFSKQSSCFIPTATKMFLSSLADSPERSFGISTGPLCLAYCYLSAAVGWLAAAAAYAPPYVRVPESRRARGYAGPSPSCSLYL